MLENTFCHLSGIGIHKERRLWSTGVFTWEDLIDHCSHASRSGRARSRAWLEHLNHSRHHLKAADPHYFADLLPPQQHWRLFRDFRSSVAYLDIETTGMGSPHDYITAITLYDGRSLSCYVHGHNMGRFREDLQNYKVIVTYNGKCFDVPFIRGYLDLSVGHVHLDLRYILKSLGYSGGLKGCERQLGIRRGELEGVDGFFAVLLWREYRKKGNLKALETMLAYNIADTVNLETLMITAYNLKLKDTPFQQSLALPHGSPPASPFQADLETIERIRRELTSHSLDMYPAASPSLPLAARNRPRE